MFAAFDHNNLFSHYANHLEAKNTLAAQSVWKSKLTTEHQLAREVLNMLRGVPGEVFFMNQNGMFERQFLVALSQLSPSASNNSLDEFIQMSNRLRLIDQSNKTGFESPSSVYQAFHSSLSNIINHYRNKLVEFEKAHLNSKSKPLTLLRIRIKMREVGRLVNIVEAVLDKKSNFEKKSENWADRVTNLLTTLYIGLQTSQSLSKNHIEHQVLWDLFLDSMTPYLTMIESWTFDGELTDQCEEFFLTKTTSHSLESQEYWTKAYQLSKLTPPFLDSIKHQFVVIGKSINLIRHIERNNHVEDEELSEVEVIRPSLTEAFLEPDLVINLFEENQFIPIGSIKYNSPRRFKLNGSHSPSSSLKLSPTHSTSSSFINISPTNSNITIAVNPKIIDRNMSVMHQFDDDHHRLNDELYNLFFSFQGNIVSQIKTSVPLKQRPIVPPPTKMPIQHYMHVRLTKHIINQYERVGTFLVQLIMPNLINDICLCRSLYLGQSGDVMDMFCARAFNDQLGADRAEWNSMLQDILRTAIENNRHVELVNPNQSDQIYKCDPFKNAFERMSISIVANNNSSQMIDSIVLNCNVEWPMNLILHSDAMNTYNQVLRYNMRIKKARNALQDLMTNAIPHDLSLLCFELYHFVINVQKYAIDGVLEEVWAEFVDRLFLVGDFDELKLAHDSYLNKIKVQCLFSKATFVKSRIIEILDMCCCIEPDCNVEDVQISFRASVRLLLSLIKSKLNQGMHIHLDGLAIRLNYNHFYDD
ncbi:gamma-tubulin complex component Tubgcp5 [Acrasis kona]|uniref:Spindle pole body component n=1 Tax=Acrasis kona TaxID=1008807 RepID=A0AAW2YSY6_9EUKA